MPTPDEIKKEKVEKKKNPTTKPKDPPKPVTKELANIGKGYFARDAVDPRQRLTNYLWTRMHMVDILPCNFEMPFVRSPESALESLVKAFTPKIRYSERMLEYETQCFKHGLPRKSGIGYSCPKASDLRNQLFSGGFSHGSLRYRLILGATILFLHGFGDGRFVHTTIFRDQIVDQLQVQ